MQPLFIILFIVGLPSITICEENCDKLGRIIYEDIGCSPVFEIGKECPVRYQCEDFASKNDSCAFRGRRYNIDEEVDQNLTYEDCYVGCRCREPKSDKKFLCAVLDCPEWLGHRPRNGCYNKYEVDKCCSVGSICPDEEKIEECEFNGQKYREGELFFPKNTCSKCMCQKGFAGKIEPPFCKRDLCSTQILHSDKLENSCAAAYFGASQESLLCCPSQWVCPSGDEKIVKVKNPNSDSNSDLSCKFGSTSIKLGEGFEKSANFYGKERNFTCECILPPLMTCKEK